MDYRYLHHPFLSAGYKDNLCKAVRNLVMSVRGISPYKSKWIGLGMRVTQLLNSSLGRSRFRTTSAYVGYRMFGCRPPKFRYYLFALMIDLPAKHMFDDPDHVYGAAKSEGYL